MDFRDDGIAGSATLGIGQLFVLASVAGIVARF